MTTDALVCPACGARMRQERRKCLRCGAVLAAASRSAKAADSTSWPARRWPWLVAAAVLAGIAAIAVYGLAGRTARAAAVPPGSLAPTAVAVPASAARPRPREPEPGVAVDPAAFARQSYQAGELETAYQRYREATERNPNDAESLSNCGQALVRMGKPADAVPYFERAIALNSGRWAYHFNLARASGLLNRWDRAVEEYQKAAALFPDDFVCEYNLGGALHRIGDEAAAIAHFRRAIELKPDEADFHLSLGTSCERAGQAADAVAAYRRYLELAPGAANAAAVQTHIDALSAPAVPAQK